MPGLLHHSPAYVIRQLLVDLGLGSNPASGTDWPVFSPKLPATPDNAIVVRGTLGTSDGRSQVNGESQMHHGFQIMVRASTDSEGEVKAQAILDALDKNVYREGVTVDGTNYCIHSVSLKGDVIPIGTETPTSKRVLFTINYTVYLVEV